MPRLLIVNVLYEEDGGFKVGAILADQNTSLQVEAAHGKRSKIKANAIVLRFDGVALSGFMEGAHRVADDLDPGFLWEVAPQDEFDYGVLARDYFGREPSPQEAAGLLLRLHSSPMHFYKKGKGRYRTAPADALKSALASAERKRKQAELQAEYTSALLRNELPEAVRERLDMLLYEPDKNAIEYKAVEAAALQSHITQLKLLERCGAIASSHEYHFRRFLRDHFPQGTGFDDASSVTTSFDDLPLTHVEAFSIDDVTTTEIDDALSVSRMDDGHWRVGIHIAAPALGITPGDALDKLAAHRLSTVYMPGDKITMLPVSAIDAFTLSENATRPVVSLYAVVDHNFDIVSTDTKVERIRVAANLRLDQLDTLFNPQSVAENALDFRFGAELKLLHNLALKLEAKRGKADAGPDRADYNFYVENDRIRIVERKRGSPLDKLVAEMMIFVNSTWGGEIARAHAAGIYRVQGGGKVKMSLVPGPHEGLGVENYAWSSSPIRRYVDLINQRQIIALANAQPTPYPTGADDVVAAARNFEIAYDAYADFQRGMERYWCLRWLLQENVKQINATVLRESLARLEGLPMVAKIPSLPELDPGTKVTLEVVDIDLLTLELDCRFLAKVPAPAL